MAQFPNTTNADGIWTLKKVRRAILGDNWPSLDGPAQEVNSASLFQIAETSLPIEFNGTETSPVTYTGVNIGTCVDFDMEFTINHDRTSTNDWFIIGAVGYQDAGGFMVGLYNSTAIAIAGDGIGAYGLNGTVNIPSGTDSLVKIEARGNSSAGSSDASLTTFIDGVQDQSGSSYNFDSIDFSTVNLGLGRSSSGGSFSHPFDGRFLSFKITKLA